MSGLPAADEPPQEMNHRCSPWEIQDERVLEQVKRLSRRAVGIQVGGFRPPDDPFGSWFGGMKVGRPGEEWPVVNGKPMEPVSQLNVSALPW